jgi:hypothetical protein
MAHICGWVPSTYLQAKLYSSMFEFDEWAKLVASYSSLMKIESQVKER